MAMKDQVTKVTSDQVFTGNNCHTRKSSPNIFCTSCLTLQQIIIIFIITTIIRPAFILLDILHHLSPQCRLGQPVLRGDELVPDVVDGEVGGPPLALSDSHLVLLIQEVGGLPH